MNLLVGPGYLLELQLMIAVVWTVPLEEVAALEHGLSVLSLPKLHPLQIFPTPDISVYRYIYRFVWETEIQIEVYRAIAIYKIAAKGYKNH